MRRVPVPPRPDWPTALERVGVTYHSMTGGYWREEAAYEFTVAEIDEVEAATEALHRLCVEAVARIILEDRFDDLRIAPAWRPRIVASWEAREPSLYGRFDLWYDGTAAPKLLEYNADTPTALLEAAVAQWEWVQTVKPGADQFNSLHERLIERWAEIRRQAKTDALYLAAMEGCEEDIQTMAYVADTAYQADWRVQTMALGAIGWDAAEQQFCDLDGWPIEVLFKLYPWEWLNEDAFAEHVSSASVTMIEPAWKQLLSHKGLLALLWEWYPDHPNLLPAWWTAPASGESYVRKPFWSREGANVTIVADGRTVATDGPYATDASVFQAYCPLPSFDGWHPVVGSWIVGAAAAGMGIREDRGLIHGDGSWFVPHYLVDL
ncbi:MAG: glutathionylspermidine synthase family protein [Nitrospiraceae bacterium]